MVSFKGYVFLLCFVSSGFARNNEDAHGGEPMPFHRPDPGHQQLRTSCMMSYVMSKGCDYVMAFVRGHYYRHGHHDDADDDQHDTMPKSCDWHPWVEGECMAYHVPQELCCALINCGVSRSMTALGGPTNVPEGCNRAYSFGKRTSRLCDTAPPVNFICQGVAAFGKRSSTPDQEFHISNVTGITQTNRLNGTVLTNSTARPNSSSNVLQAHPPDPNEQASSIKHPRVQRWCKLFSRKVSKKYHLNEVRFVRHSVYWLVDIYKAAHRHHVPKAFTHGLVGCGMEYAMSAFNVEKWQTKLYSLALE